MSNLTLAKKKVLDNWANMGFQILRRPGDSKKALSFTVAALVGRQAVRIFLEEKDLAEWLQSAYGSIWVRNSNLVPGADLKEIREVMIKAYRGYKGKGIKNDSARV